VTPRSPEASRAAREEAAERILAAAAKVFAHRGYAGTKVADIAAQAGVSSGLVHHYFATKADVFRTLITTIMSAATTTPQEALDRPGTPGENLRWMLEQMLLGAAYLPEHYLLTMQAQMSEAAPEDVRTLITERGAVGFALMTEVVARAQREGTARAGDPVALMVHLLAVIQGLAIQIAFEDRRSDDVPDLEVVLAMLSPRETEKGGAS
jgi:AcrR family transcriptional regulator